MDQPCRSILIVEDDIDIRESLQATLTHEGYLVYTAVNGREGLDVLPRIERPCLILLDLMMPVMNGWEFLSFLRKNDLLATIPVIVVSAYVSESQPLPVEAVIKKPFDLDLLLDFVRKFCKA